MISAMYARLLADAILLLHFAFILFAVFGAFPALRWPRLLWAHIPAVLWSAWVHLAHRICPLTPLENELRYMAGETRNAGLVFGEPRLLVDVDDAGEVNLKTGISMPQFFARAGRYFVGYNINKEHLLLDEIPAAILDEMTPD